MGMIETYYHLIINGEKKIYEVPSQYREHVIELLKSHGYEELTY